MKLFLIALLALFAIVQNGNRSREANRAYEQGDYQRAEKLYREILMDQPDNRLILFNLGNSLALQGNTDASREAFQRYQELADNPADRAPSEYNLGYLQGNDGNTETAMQHFRNTLELFSADEDAKFNYELLKRRNVNDEKNQQEQEQTQDGQPPPSSDNEGQPENDESGQSNSPQMDQQQPSSNEESQRGRPEVTDEELRHAQDIMNALERIEKDLIKDFMKRQLDPANPHERDW